MKISAVLWNGLLLASIRWSGGFKLQIGGSAIHPLMNRKKAGEHAQFRLYQVRLQEPTMPFLLLLPDAKFDGDYSCPV